MGVGRSPGSTRRINIESASRSAEVKRFTGFRFVNFFSANVSEIIRKGYFALYSITLGQRFSP